MSWLINIFKKIYEEVKEDIFDMDNVRMFLKTLRRNQSTESTGGDGCIEAFK